MCPVALNPVTGQPCNEWDEVLLLAVRTTDGILINPSSSYTIDPSDKGILSLGFVLCACPRLMPSANSVMKSGIFISAKENVAAAVKDIEKGVPMPISGKGWLLFLLTAKLPSLTSRARRRRDGWVFIIEECRRTMLFLSHNGLSASPQQRHDIRCQSYHHRLVSVQMSIGRR